jgi:hypothetical protein
MKRPFEGRDLLFRILWAIHRPTTHISIYVLLPSGENLAEKQPKKKQLENKDKKRNKTKR